MTSKKERLATAWTVLKRHIDEKTRVMSAHEKAQFIDQFAMRIGVVKKTFDKWLDTGITLDVDAEPQKLQSIMEFVRVLDIDWNLAHAIALSLSMDPDHCFTLYNYKGFYNCYRLGKDDLIVGKVSIDNRGGFKPWMHFHESTQDIGGDKHKFSHSGPIFNVMNRIYMFGAGTGFEGKYFRPMIFSAVDHPERDVTFGIVLTEGFESQRPLSAKVALIREGSPRLKEDNYKAKVSQMLQVEPEKQMLGYSSIKI
jgi:hypothetical protein